MLKFVHVEFGGDFILLVDACRIFYQSRSIIMQVLGFSKIGGHIQLFVNSISFLANGNYLRSEDHLCVELVCPTGSSSPHNCALWSHSKKRYRSDSIAPHEGCLQNIMSGKYPLRNDNEIGLAVTTRPDKTVDLRRIGKTSFRRRRDAAIHIWTRSESIASGRSRPTCQNYTIPFAYLAYEKQHHNVIPVHSGTTSIVLCRSDGVGEHQHPKL